MKYHHITIQNEKLWLIEVPDFGELIPATPELIKKYLQELKSEIFWAQKYLEGLNNA